ncbi:MAG: precorrin-6y C5,15-methyltransferase (decarboxylating) subunit CbiE [Clostridia bacterium]|jgi:precorrin-6Y C5,15-methyltransferase (decarboxylating)|nr:precorrin-6y C5,15-methyltransferase (decarboxylating) subunit CbiE [Clostridia bacterium]
MKQVVIVGLGMSAATLTAEGLRAVEQADVLIGAPRLIAPFKKLNKPCFAEYTPEEVTRLIDGQEGRRFCVLVSGDTGFYSAAEGLCAALQGYSPTLIPGVSSMSYFCARLLLPWQDAVAVSCHGHQANLVDAVRRNRLTFVLTGGNVADLGEKLTQAGFGELTAHMGECLGGPQERILTLPVYDLAGLGVGNLAVLLVENPVYDRRVRFGIPDEEFLRGNLPMTKSEVRAVTMSRLALSPQAVCCDIGAGTGSVTVEMALAAYEGKVYALDKSEEAIRLVTDNCRRFHLGNVTPVCGAAPEALEGLPPLDAGFIGGNSGRLGGIFEALLRKNPQIRLVVNAVTLETLHAATEAFRAQAIAPEIIQVGINRARAVGNRRILQAGSPVFILSGGKNE